MKPTRAFYKRTRLFQTINSVINVILMTGGSAGSHGRRKIHLFCRYFVKMAWMDAECRCLIELWGEDDVQGQLEGCKRNREVYGRLARKMREKGFERTGEQCREKIKKLKREYRKVKDNNGEGAKDVQILRGDGQGAWTQAGYLSSCTH
eukprot:m.251737 g.251737  ORF g.251737 m.251737 type:complete len:149 (+) comp40338_c0_seq24:624-1070(+)